MIGFEWPLAAFKNKVRILETFEKNVTRALKAIPQECFQKCFEQWQHRWAKCVAAKGSVTPVSKL